MAGAPVSPASSPGITHFKATDEHGSDPCLSVANFLCSHDITSTMKLLALTVVVIATLSCQHVARLATTKVISNSSASTKKLHLPQPWLELFKNAMWIEGGYILLPLNKSLDSFAFWQLPGGV